MMNWDYRSPKAGKVPGHGSGLMVSYVREMTLKPIKYFFSSTHILNVSNVAFQTIYEIIALAVPMHYIAIGMV